MTRGLWTLVQHGRVPLASSLEKTPWWWSHIAHHETRFQQIAELAAWDEEGQAPPKEYWFSGAHKDLEEWVEQRKNKRKG